MPPSSHIFRVKHVSSDENQGEICAAWEEIRRGNEAPASPSEKLSPPCSPLIAPPGALSRPAQVPLTPSLGGLSLCLVSLSHLTTQTQPNISLIHLSFERSGSRTGWIGRFCFEKSEGPEPTKRTIRDRSDEQVPTDRPSAATEAGIEFKDCMTSRGERCCRPRVVET